jgi:hypothetical protein
LKLPVLAGTRFADSPAIGNNFWRVTGVADFCTADSPHPDPGQSAVQFLRRVHNCLGSVCSSVFDLRTVWDYTRGQSAVVVCEFRTGCQVSCARGRQSVPLSRTVQHSSHGQFAPLPRTVRNCAVKAFLVRPLWGLFLSLLKPSRVCPTLRVKYLATG